MAIKAVHLELVNDLSCNAFTAALKRFISRREMFKQNIYCDNENNFVGAARSLTDPYEWVIKNKEKNAQVCLPDCIEWHFIPPNSPYMCGLLEASVQSVKYHLHRIIETEYLTFEEVATLISQIEACLNSRPITSQSNDPNDERPLTPAHFLVGDSILLPIEQDNADTPMNKLQRWSRVQSMVQSLWERWSNDYITSLQQRGKWHKQCPNINVGDLVIIKETNIPPSH